MTRMAAASLGAILLLTSCGGSDLKSYSSVEDMAAALDEAGLDCDHPVALEEATGPKADQRLPSDSASCGSGDEAVQLFLFEDEKTRDDWLTLGGKFSKNVVTGPDWAVIATDEETAAYVADALGGET